MINVALRQAQIRFEYQEAMNRARELDEIARELDRAKAEVDEAMGPLRLGWEGQSATACQRKGAQLRGLVADQSRALRSSAEEVRQIARRVRAIEQANLQLVLERG